MGAPPSLPFFTPQQVQATPGARPSVIDPPAGTLPYRMPAVAGIAQGLDNMVTNYHNQKQAHEQYYQDKVWNAIRFKMLGIGSVDDQTIMKWAGKAGIPVKMRDVGQLQYEQQHQAQMSQYAAQQAAANAGTSFRGVPIPQPAGGPPAFLPPPAAPGPHGLLGHLAYALRGGRAADPNLRYDTSGLQDLGAAVAAGGGLAGSVQRKAELEAAQTKAEVARAGAAGSQADVQKTMSDNFLNDWPEMSRDPFSPKWLNYQHMDMAHGLGGLGDLMEMIGARSPGGTSGTATIGGQKISDIKDQIFSNQLAQAMGRPTYQEFVGKLSEAMTPRFKGNYELAHQYAEDMFFDHHSRLTPGYTTKETNELSEADKNNGALFPGQSAEFVHAISEAQVNGVNTDPIFAALEPYKTVDKSGKVTYQIPHYSPSREQSIKSAEFGVTSGIEQQRASAETSQAGTAATKATEEIRQRQEQIDLDKSKAVMAQLTEQQKIFLGQMHDENLPRFERIAAARNLKTTLNTMSKVPVPIGNNLSYVDPQEVVNGWAMNSDTMKDIWLASNPDIPYVVPKDATDLIPKSPAQPAGPTKPVYPPQPGPPRLNRPGAGTVYPNVGGAGGTAPAPATPPATSGAAGAPSSSLWQPPDNTLSGWRPRGLHYGRQGSYGGVDLDNTRQMIGNMLSGFDEPSQRKLMNGLAQEHFGLGDDQQLPEDTMSRILSYVNGRPPAPQAPPTLPTTPGSLGAGLSPFAA